MSYTKLKGLAATLPAVVALAACGGGGQSASSTSQASPASQPAQPSAMALIHTASVQVGNQSMTVLKDPKGLTLYYYTPDTSTKIACTGQCAKIWPPLLASSGTPTSASPLPGKLTVMNGPNGPQVAYAGHPLYLYVKDKDSEDAYGQGLGGKWFVATPDLHANM
jgi:predicted lipoprotein with Yx(FWY)xxD motif